jgi:hypothetical protein
MALSGDLELTLGTECVQDESEVPGCRFCSDPYETNIEELPHGVAQDCSNCRLLLDAIETWNETENLELHKFFVYPDIHSSKTWLRSDIQLRTEETHRSPDDIFLRVSPDAGKLLPTVPCSTCTIRLI